MAQQHSGDNAKEIVKNFLLEVRSGRYPDRANNFMSGTVLAHQVVSEKPVTVLRTPENYADHIREFLEMFGKFNFEITELIAEGNKVYARWKQTGKHASTIESYEPTGLPLIDFGVVATMLLCHNLMSVSHGMKSDKWSNLHAFLFTAKILQLAIE